MTVHSPPPPQDYKEAKGIQVPTYFVLRAAVNFTQWKSFWSIKIVFFIFLSAFIHLMFSNFSFHFSLEKLTLRCAQQAWIRSDTTAAAVGDNLLLVNKWVDLFSPSMTCYWQDVNYKFASNHADYIERVISCLSWISQGKNAMYFPHYLTNHDSIGPI